MPYHLGASEPFLGRALQGGWREKVKIATKMPHWNVHARRTWTGSCRCSWQTSRPTTSTTISSTTCRGSWKKLKGPRRFGFHLGGASGTGGSAASAFPTTAERMTFRAIVDDYPLAVLPAADQLPRTTENQALASKGMRYAAEGVGPPRGDPRALGDMNEEQRNRGKPADCRARLSRTIR